MIRVSGDEIWIVGVSTDKIDLTGAPQKKIVVLDCIVGKKIVFGHITDRGLGPRVY